MTLLSRYQQIAATTQNIVSTDIPQSVVGDFADLALKVKDAGIQSVVFDDSVIKPAYPDYDKIQGLVQDALHPPAARRRPHAGTDRHRGTGAATHGRPASGSDDRGGHLGRRAPTSPAVSATDACAYDPVAAQEALDEGEPPTKSGR